MKPKKCPKDANIGRNKRHDQPEGKNLCAHTIRGDGRDGKWWCTRHKNHAGPHHAHSKGSNECAATWTTEEAIIDAL